MFPSGKKGLGFDIFKYYLISGFVGVSKIRKYNKRWYIIRFGNFKNNII